MAFEEKFSALLRSFRKDGDLSQEALGAFPGVSQRTISRWERGVDHPSPALMERLIALMSEDHGGRLPAVFEAVRNASTPLAVIDGKGRILVASPSFTGAGPKSPDSSSSEPPLILVVEDDEAVLAATQAVLKQWQFRTVGVTHGQSALDLIVSGKVVPNAALVDFVLPGGMDGVDTALALRTPLPALPILIVSGDDRVEARQKVADAGFVLITKPVDPKQVRIALLSLISP